MLKKSLYKREILASFNFVLFKRVSYKKGNRVKFMGFEGEI